MTDQKSLDLNGVIENDAERKRARKSAEKVVKFRDYLNMVKDDPTIAQNSPARLLEVIQNHGTTEIPEEERWSLDEGEPVTVRYNLFSKHLFGVEKSVFQVVKYLKAGASRLSTGKQILLLVGPTASGKSTFANILKRALENYETKQVFAIDGCPMLEEPLHLLPRHLRTEFEQKLGMRIEGDLCPVCRYKLKEEFTENDGVVRWYDVPVKTFRFSVQGTRGIGSFEPSDEKSQDITELVGRENIAIASTKGPDHPLAYSLTGELEKANRGICEGRELIKADEKLLWVFISVAEEKEIKVQGSSFPHLHVDTVVIGHTNLTEYKKFSTKQENEALHDRMFVVQFPYPLEIKKEVAIYKKLIQQESDFSRISKSHIAPGAFELAALFAVLTRLSPSEMGVDVLTKAKIYNGDRALTEIRDKDKKPIDLRELREEGQSSDDIMKREGMSGLSSRDTLAAINTALVKQSNGCLTPLTVIKALRDLFEHRMGYSPEEIKRFKELLSAGEGGSVITEYKEFVIRSVSKAYLKAYHDLAKELFRRYVGEVKFYREQKRKHVRGHFDVVREDITGRPKEPDIKFMRSVEEHIPIAESEADVFRGEILEFVATNSNFSYETYTPLARAVEEKLLADSRATLTLVLASDKPKDSEAKKRADDLFSELTREGGMGFCPICSKEVVEKATEFLSE
ncbi:MAG: hypothetical protein A2750_02385 [Candidatus Yanofskybacteria bacterium RIFCSPHIGHO2_01_FULL_45_42]|uniref:PrkA AAA domain-containing protein n=2 Tax=Candidatus Yanofskyibacteriota TaxID=1752733 RepID=A0A1F8FPL2_9BACT|nr:MAG: hypothetical protein A2750_02385 [Candidatus Yanofskybacteria bacterium RIFCSPHIGHO2_01_FULL_45_42]OGN14951.1 MAG: hypothetical protein A3J47_00885 [Candidatus Yanofskybacteria bacterium RIFCSPHIGHO2_02_FULL_43_22]